MNIFEILRSYWSDKTVLLGWGGAGGFWTAEELQVISGMLLTITMMITSIVMQAIKIQSLRNEDRRKEERHRQELLQDQERHERELNRKKED